MLIKKIYYTSFYKMIPYVTAEFAQQVITEIGLTRNDLEALTKIKGTYQKYYKQIIWYFEKTICAFK